ncbi:DUF6177 family protein [Pseudoclavibacter albus]|uniref:DUF6177 family protein n=1 Tax=Pseudoclavibacter albus TaxID=272241 RepID=UPI0021A7A1EE
MRENPAADAMGAGFVVTTSAAPIVHLSEARLHLIVEAARERRRTLLITSNGSRLTPALHAFLSDHVGVWMVSTENGLRDANTGIRYESPADALRPLPEPVLAEEHAEAELSSFTLTEIVEIAVRFRHHSSARSKIGSTGLKLAEALLDEPIMTWGLREPLVLPWLDNEPGQYMEGRLSGPVQCFASGQDENGHRITLDIRGIPSSLGIDEVIHLKACLGPREAEDDGRWEQVADTMRMLATLPGNLLNATAYGTAGPHDLSVWPWVRIPSLPMVLMIGATGLRRFGILERRALIEEHFQAEFLGPRRVPNLMVELGHEPESDNIEELAALSYALGPAALEGGIGTATLAGLGDDLQARARASFAARFGDDALADVDAFNVAHESTESESDSTTSDEKQENDA